MTPCLATCQAPLFITNSQSLLKLMSTESVMPSNHLILCRPLFSCPQSFPASGSFLINQFFSWGGQSIGAFTSASVLPMNTQDWWLVKTLIIGKHHLLSIKNIFEQIEWEVWYEKHIQTFAVLIATTKFSYTGALYVHYHILMNIDLQRFALLVCLPLFCLRFQRISLSFIV